MNCAIRPAISSDVDALVELETTCFDSDRISRRSFRRFLQSERDILLVAEADDQLQGYILLLLRRGTRLARLYSVCVDARCRGQRIAERLIVAAEQSALSAGCAYLRLEVREDNRGAIRLYRKLGYHPFARVEEYYEDGATALRFERRIREYDDSQRNLEIPYYAQTTRFSCGAASLLMIMHALNQQIELSQTNELRLWREATTIFMTAGHGGCGPHGLALAAFRRGFAVEIWLNQNGPLFADGVRDPDKKRIMHVVQQDFEQQLTEHGVAIHPSALGVDDMARQLESGHIPLVLISCWSLTREKTPHWVVVSAVDDQFVYIHDPDLDEEAQESSVDKQYVPIDRDSFQRISRFGQAALRAAVVIGRVVTQ